MKLSDDTKKAAKYGARLGFVLAIVCHLLPSEYRIACETIAKICTGGF